MLEHGEAFGLILIQRVALAIATQVNHLAQIIIGNDMFAPQLVERLQQHRLFNLVRQVLVGHRLVPFLTLTVVESVNSFGHALANLFIGNAFFLCPIINRKIHGHGFTQALPKANSIPLLCIGIFRNMFGHKIVHDVVAHIIHGFRNFLALHNTNALIKDHFALVIHHIVELEQVFADVEIACFHFLLRRFQRFVDPS